MEDVEACEVGVLDRPGYWPPVGGLGFRDILSF